MENEQEERKKIQNHVMNDAIFHLQKKYKYEPQEHFDPHNIVHTDTFVYKMFEWLRTTVVLS